MWNHFTFDNGANPYITKTDNAFFKMLCKYPFIEFESEDENNNFLVNCADVPIVATGYSGKKERLREFAKEYQWHFTESNMYYSELAEWCNFFYTFGKRYGLLKEFNENGII